MLKNCIPRCIKYKVYKGSVYKGPGGQENMLLVQCCTLVMFIHVHILVHVHDVQSVNNIQNIYTGGDPHTVACIRSLEQGSLSYSYYCYFLKLSVYGS